AALTRTGSLSGAVATVRAEREEPQLRSISGGMSRLVDALVADLELLGVELRTQAPVAALTRGEAGWVTQLSASDDTVDDTEIASDAVVLATDETTARALLAPSVSALGDP